VLCVGKFVVDVCEYVCAGCGTDLFCYGVVSLCCVWDSLMWFVGVYVCCVRENYVWIWGSIFVLFVGVICDFRVVSVCCERECLG